MLLEKYTYQSKAGSSRNVNSYVRMLTSQPIQETTLRPYRPDTAFCRSALPSVLTTNPIKFTVSPFPRLAPTHPFTSALTHKNLPQFYLLALSLPTGRPIAIAIQCQQPIIQQRETRRSRNSVHFTDGRNSTKPSTATEVCHEVTPYS